MFEIGTKFDHFSRFEELLFKLRIVVIPYVYRSYRDTSIVCKYIIIHSFHKMVRSAAKFGSVMHYMISVYLLYVTERYYIVHNGQLNSTLLF